ncbi:MAG: amino acid ABC transporter ATP-binding protein, partial [Firmicutes bacterium]|nr:amino acid ABC transporter ATP-binding protein [Candidatus Caballimonas caccae]
MIKIENLKLNLSGANIFDGLDLEIKKGEVVGIIGASGTGKSTLLKCIMKLVKVDDGKIYFNGKEITEGNIASEKLCEKIGMIFQDFNLFKHLSVIENVMSGQVDVQRIDKKTAYENSMRILKFVALLDKAFAFPDTLSGGQKQRTAIARTLAMNPEIILMDEPTSSLDPIAKGEVQSVIRMLAKENRTMVIVSHELELIKDVCTRVVFLNKGKVFEEGTPHEILDNPKKKETRVFVKALRVLTVDIESKDFDFIGLSTTFAEYAYRISMPQNLLTKMQSVLEEFFHVIIIDNKDKNKMHVALLYNDKDKILEGTIYSSGKKIDT